MLPPTEGKIFSTETVSTERNLESNARVQILIVQLSNCMTPISKCLSFLNCKIRIIIIKFTLRVTVTNEFNTCNELKSALGKRPMSYFPLHYVCTLLPKLVSHTVNRSTPAHTRTHTPRRSARLAHGLHAGPRHGRPLCARAPTTLRAGQGFPTRPDLATLGGAACLEASP